MGLGPDLPHGLLADIAVLRGSRDVAALLERRRSSSGRDRALADLHYRRHPARRLTELALFSRRGRAALRRLVAAEIDEW